jgi:hypothetical protein
MIKEKKGGTIMNELFIEKLIISFFVALGVMIGGALIGGIGAFFVNQPPLDKIAILADRLKIWALVAAIGGTFDTFTNLERGIFYGTHLVLIKQILFVLAAMGGAQTGALILQWITQESMTS